MKRLLTVFLLWASSIALFAQQLRVEAPAAVGLDERFNVTFIIEGEERPSSFEWDEGGDFVLEWGPQTGTSTNISVVNGKRTKSSQTTYTYILSPKSKGKFTLPSAKATVGGKVLQSGVHTIEVVSEGASAPSSSGSASQSGQTSMSSGSDISEGDLFMRLILSKRDVVVGEPVTATLKLYQRVSVTGFEDARFPAFDGFWSQETAAPTNIQFSRETLDDKIYDAAVLRSYTLVPQKSGDLKIDPAELVCLVNVRTQSRPMSIFDEFFDSGYRTVRKRISTPAMTVHVRPVPSGAPSSFGGGVGTFSIDARLSRDNMKANDAASLIVTISGKGNVSLLSAPQVNFHPDMEVYDVKVTDNSDRSSGGLSGSKTFEYPFIPRSHGDFEIEPIEYSYYDVNAGRYVTLHTDALPYTVEKNGNPSSTGGTTLQTPERKGVKNLAEDIRYISRKTPSFRKASPFFVAKAGYWIIVVLLFAVSGAALLILRKMAALKADTALSRNRKASRAAHKRLALARDYMSKSLSAAFYEELHRALLGYVSDKFGIAPEDLNRDFISSRLSGGNVPEEVTKRFIELLDACEYARYAPSAGAEALNSHYSSAVEVISSMESSMKNKKSDIGKGLALIVGLLILPTSLMSAQTSAQALWDEGTAAYADGRWEDAAAAWESLLDEGYSDADIYYNLGNAWFKAAEFPKAILNYERALKEDLSFSDARFNLELANSQIQDRIDAVPEFIFKTWMRKACRTLSSNTWAVLSLLFLAITLGLLLLFILGNGSALKRTGFYGAIAAFLVTIFSFSMARWQFSDYRDGSQAIVMSPVSSVKSSPSEGSAKDLFVLHGGVKLRILDVVGEWSNIMLSDGRQGWVKTNDIEII